MIFIFIFIFIYSAFFLKKNVTYLFPLFFSFIFLYTYFGANFFVYAYDIPFADQFAYKIDLQGVGFAYLTTIFGFTFGVELARRNYSWGYNNKKLIFSNNFSNSKSRNINIANIYIYSSFIFSIILVFFTFNVNQILHRNGYMVENINSLLIIYKLSVVLAIFLVAYIENKVIRNFCFFILLLVPFSLSSRIFCLCVFIFYFSLYVKNGLKIDLKSKIVCLFLLLFSFLTSLGFRGNELQGLIPNFIALSQIGSYFDIFFKSLNYVTSFSVFASQYAIDYGYSDLKSFYISINPLPSSFLDIDYILSKSMLNVFAPTPAIAMSYNAGPFICFLYYFICGFVFTFIFKKMNFGLFYSFMVCLFVYFVFSNTQYIVREGARLFYYFILFYFIYRIYFLLKKSKMGEFSV